MKNSPKGLPSILVRLLQKIDVYGDLPVIFVKEDIAPAAMPLMATLIKQKLVTQCLASYVFCINCDAQANVIRVGNKGKSLFALCRVCGHNFRASEDDIQEFRVTWASLSAWVSNIFGLPDESEAISPNVYFLGHHQHGAVSYEIHLMKGCALDDAKQGYEAIVQQKTKPAIILSLSNKPRPCTSREVIIVPLAESLAYGNGGYHINFPAWVFSGVDPVKQRAGQTRVVNDPLQRQKDILRGFVQRNLRSMFTTHMHHDIAIAIAQEHAEQITYEDKRGNPKKLLPAMVRDVIKDVLIEKDYQSAFPDENQPMLKGVPFSTRGDPQQGAPPFTMHCP